MNGDAPSDHRPGRDLVSYLIGTNVIAILGASSLLSSGQMTFANAAILTALVGSTVRRRPSFPIRHSLTMWGSVGLILLLAFRVASQIAHSGDFRLMRNLLEAMGLLFVFGSRDDWPSQVDGVRRYARFFVLATFAAVFGAVLLGIEGVWSRGRLAGILANAVNNGLTASILLPFVVSEEERSTSRSAGILGLVLIVLLARSRSAMIISAMTLFLAWLAPWRRPLSFSIRQVTAALAVVAVGLMFQDEIASFLTRDQSKRDLLSLTGRVRLWDVAVNYISQEPLFGVGSEATTMKMWVRYAHRYWSSTGSAHNTFLASAAVLGIPFAVSLMAQLIGSAIISIKRYCQAPSPLSRIFGPCALGILFASLFEANLDYSYLPIGLVFWWAILVAGSRVSAK